MLNSGVWKETRALLCFLEGGSQKGRQKASQGIPFQEQPSFAAGGLLKLVEALLTGSYSTPLGDFEHSDQGPLLKEDYYERDRCCTTGGLVMFRALFQRTHDEK